MKLWICSLVFPAVILSVSAQTCPPDYFTATLLFASEPRLEVTEPPFAPDPELTFFRDVLNLRESDIQHTVEDAIKFFDNSFGLDFSNSIPNEQNERFIENAKMGPFRTPSNVLEFATVSNWLRSGSTRSSCYLVQNGLLAITFNASLTVHGRYGGPAGKPVGVPDVIVYGFYHIDVCQQSPVIIQLQSATPVRFVPVDGITVFTHDLYSRALGYGRAQGSIVARPDPDDPRYIRYTVRNALTFP